MILVEAAPAVLPPMGPKLGLKAQRQLEKMGVEVKLNTMVTDVDYMGLTVKEKDGEEYRIECAVKVWSAGVQASPLGKLVAEQSDGTEVDRAGRVVVEPDLTVKGHPNVFVVGDMMSVPNVPGMAQGAIQGAVYATKQIKSELKGADPANRQPFKYRNKGSMSTISRFHAVCQIGKIEFAGFFAWLAWLGPAPVLPRRRPQPPRRGHLVVRHLPRQGARAVGDHRTLGVRAQGAGAVQGAERPKIHWMTRAKIDSP